MNLNILNLQMDIIPEDVMLKHVLTKLNWLDYSPLSNVDNRFYRLVRLLAKSGKIVRFLRIIQTPFALRMENMWVDKTHPQDRMFTDEISPAKSEWIASLIRDERCIPGTMGVHCSYCALQYEHIRT